MDEGEKNNKNTNTRKKNNIKSNVSDVLSPIWVRRFIQESNGLDRLILESGYYFLLPFGFFLDIIYLFT